MANKYSRWCSVEPCILRVDDKVKTVTIHPQQEHIAKLLSKDFVIKVTRTGCVINNNVEVTMKNTCDTPYVCRENGDIVFEMKAGAEGEYSIMLFDKKDDGTLGSWMSFQLYALENDLFEKIPCKGDFHMHSFCSDGTESPAYVAASCRMHGMDFMALTDHKQYAPSLEAQKAMRELNCDMLVLPGEEVHLPGNPTHIVNFGGNRSVNELAYGNEEQFQKEVSEYKAKLPDYGDDLTNYQVAVSEWTFDKIREFSGVSLFSHPYWRPWAHNYVGEAVVDAIYERAKFDAVEVFGGFDRPDVEFNMLSMVRFYEEKAKGKTFSPVGVSDAHGSDERLAGWYFTIVFVPQLDFASVSEAIKNSMCVAVHHIPGQKPIVAGSFRLAKYAQFLLREFYPEHDELCRIEGEIMRRALAGKEPEAAKYMSDKRGVVAKFIASAKEQL